MGKETKGPGTKKKLGKHRAQDSAQPQQEHRGGGKMQNLRPRTEAPESESARLYTHRSVRGAGL